MHSSLLVYRPNIATHCLSTERKYIIFNWIEWLLYCLLCMSCPVQQVSSAAFHLVKPLSELTGLNFRTDKNCCYPVMFINIRFMSFYDGTFVSCPVMCGLSVSIRWKVLCMHNERKSEQAHISHAPTLLENAVNNEWLFQASVIGHWTENLLRCKTVSVVSFILVKFLSSKKA